MIHTDINEANQRIAELESLYTSLKSKISGNRIIANDFIIGHKNLLSIPIPLKKFAKDDIEIDFMTVLEYCEVNRQTLLSSPDNEFFALPFEMMDIMNDYNGVKEAISNTTLEINGYKLSDLFGGVQPSMGGTDYSKSDDNLVWILSYSCFQEFKRLNPHWISNEMV